MTKLTRASEIVHGVHLPFGAGAVMRRVHVAAVDHRISHGLVGVFDRELGAKAVADAFLGTLLHLLKDAQVLFHWRFAALGSDAVPSLVAHSFLVGIVGIGMSLLDHLDRHIVKIIKVVTGVGEGIALDAHHGKILDDGILVFLLLFVGVCVIETEAKLALVLLGKVPGEKSCLGMSNMEVSRRLGQESGNNALVCSCLLAQ